MLIKAYYRNDYSYSVESGGLSNREGVMVSMKVDTGSPYTIISLETRFPGISKNKIIQFREKIARTHVEPISPKSASGQQILCYPVILDKVTLDGSMFTDFPIYLATNIDRKLSLIGLDFLNCCGLEKKYGSDVFTINIENLQEYREAFKKQHMDNILDINDIA